NGVSGAAQPLQGERARAASLRRARLQDRDRAPQACRRPLVEGDRGLYSELSRRMGMAPQIDFGVNVNTRCPVIYPEHYPAARMVDLGEELERLGYDTVFVGDNYFSKPRLESTATLAAIAGRTRRIKLATSALIAPLRNTVWLALGWATIDLIANGRTILVVCVGGGSAEAGGPEFTREFDVAGVPYAKRGAILEEQIEVLRRLWTEPRTTFKGQFHNLENIAFGPKPAQPGGPPIWIANNPQIFSLKPALV